MNKNKYIYLLRGVGMGFILAAMIFFSLRSTFVNESKNDLTNSEIMIMAKDLGMIPLTDIDKVELSDEEIIKKAEELGMEMINTDN